MTTKIEDAKTEQVRTTPAPSKWTKTTAPFREGNNMIRRCLGWGESRHAPMTLGEKRPFGDKSLSDGMCEDCEREMERSYQVIDMSRGAADAGEKFAAHERRKDAIKRALACWEVWILAISATYIIPRLVFWAAHGLRILGR